MVHWWLPPMWEGYRSWYGTAARATASYARDPAALADKIMLLLTDEELRRRMGQCAACWAASYAWPRIADRIKAVYAEVVVRPGPLA